MYNTPLISVITVCLNSSEFIECCIKSVLSQNFTNFEYVIIDGGSSDGTIEIIKKYQDKISYWHTRFDRGLADAFNIGFENSNGRWILFINADDYLINPNILSRVSEYLKNWPKSDVVLGQINLMTREKYPELKSGPHGKPISWNELRFKAIIPHQAAFTSRNYFRKVGMYDLSYRTIMDYEHFLRKGSRIDIKFIPVVISCMRDGGQSKMNIKKSLRDLRNAQIKTKALPAIVAELNLYYLYIRYLVGITPIGKPWREFRNKRLRHARYLQIR